MEIFSYLTVKSTSEGLYKEKGSKFLSFLHPVSSREEIQTVLKEYKSKFYDARHICFAFRLGLEGEDFRAYDDGEPGHSAGDPILNQLKSKELTDVLLIVVRYSGGTKLGISGLVSAYKNAALQAIDSSQVIKKELLIEMEIVVEFSQIDFLMKLVSNYEAKILTQNFDIQATYTVLIPKRNLVFFKNDLEEINY